MTGLDSPTTRSYRERIYGSYLTAFKGGGSRDELSRAFEKQARFFDHLLGPVLEERPNHVLEVGCGAGPFLYWAAARGIASVRGVDVSAEQVAAARSLDLPADVASFQDYLPGCREQFDLVVGLDLVEHLTRDEALAFLDLSRAALRPGGRLFLTTPNGAALRPGPVWHGDLTHETIFTPQTMALALRLAGLEPLEMSEIAPPLTGVRSRARRALWYLVRLVPMAIDLIETGSSGSRVYTRNMAVLARRPLDASG